MSRRNRATPAVVLEVDEYDLKATVTLLAVRGIERVTIQSVDVDPGGCRPAVLDLFRQHGALLADVLGVPFDDDTV